MIMWTMPRASDLTGGAPRRSLFAEEARMGELAGRQAIILGGGGGIGAAVSRALGAAGCRLFVGDRDAPAMAATLQDLHGQGIEVASSPLDVLSVSSLDEFFTAAAKWSDSADILVNVAGGTLRRRFEEGTRDDDLRDVRLNYLYVIDSIRAALPLLRASGRGAAIVNFTTIEAHRGAATFAVYAGAKAATTNLSRALAVELAPERIRVNCVVPDTTPSKGNEAALPDMVKAELSSLSPEALRAMLAMYVPMGAPPCADDLAQAVLFLASDRARSITGVALHVDGGTSAAAGFINWPHGDGFLPAPLAGTLSRLFP
jgi:NAD(P)-dependent dehydrogenase (short-subunit alcohol dehydrogenase family)